MDIAAFLSAINNKLPPAPELEVSRLEGELGHKLPKDYREFLVACNGGYVGGALWFRGPTPLGERADAGVHHIGGFRKETYFSLRWARDCYEGRIPGDLLWIMDDPFGNAICLGVSGASRGKVFFWDHEIERDERWDGTVEAAENVQLLANSFVEFVGGLRSAEDDA